MGVAREGGGREGPRNQLGVIPPPTGVWVVVGVPCTVVSKAILSGVLPVETSLIETLLDKSTLIRAFLIEGVPNRSAPH